MGDIFPRKPVLDRIYVREIPIAEYYEQPEGIDIDLDNKHIKERSDRGVVVAVSKQVESAGEVAVGDTVYFDEFATTDPIYLNPAHRLRNDLPKYYQIRVADLKGVDVGKAVAVYAACDKSWTASGMNMRCIQRHGHDGNCFGVRDPMNEFADQINA